MRHYAQEIKDIEARGFKLVSTTELSQMIGINLSSQKLMELGAIPMWHAKHGTFWDIEDYESICSMLAEYFTGGGKKYLGY